MDECFVGGAISEGTYHVGVGGIGEFIPLLGEALDVILEAFLALPGAPLEIPVAPKEFVSAMEDSHKGLTEFDQVMDGAARQVRKLGPRPLREVDSEELDDHMVVLDSHHAAGKTIMFQPDAGICGPIILSDVCWRSHLSGELHLLNCATEGVPHPIRMELGLCSRLLACGYSISSYSCHRLLRM